MFGAHLCPCCFSGCRGYGLVQGETNFLICEEEPLPPCSSCVSDRFSFSQIAAEVIRPAGRAGMCLDLLLFNLAQIVLHWHFWGFFGKSRQTELGAVKFHNWDHAFFKNLMEKCSCPMVSNSSSSLQNILRPVGSAWLYPMDHSWCKLIHWQFWGTLTKPRNFVIYFFSLPQP